MLVILRESIDNLGRIGDVVKVSDGYARNFLLPRGMVVAANENNLKEIEHHKRVLEKKRLAERAGAEELAKKLGELTITFKRKVGKNDKLFGSVGAPDIVAEIEKAGFTVRKGSVHLKDTLKTLGVHSVEVKLQPEVVATIKVWIAKEEE
ncbi:MAG: 50S ribosomal protein L9 [Bacteriovoracia bacterium]